MKNALVAAALLLSTLGVGSATVQHYTGTSQATTVHTAAPVPGDLGWGSIPS